MTLQDRWDYNGGLRTQFPVAALRVVYAKAGTLPAAMLVRDELALIDHKLYWANVATEDEGHYLAAILNSETVRERAEQWQSTGQWGARDFDKVAFSLPISTFDMRLALHSDLAAAGAEAERIAAGVTGLDAVKFRRARAMIRTVLQSNGVAGRIETLVARLLDG